MYRGVADFSAMGVQPSPPPFPPLPLLSPPPPPMASVSEPKHFFSKLQMLVREF
jgi:hypothetical protein